MCLERLTETIREKTSTLLLGHRKDVLSACQELVHHRLRHDKLTERISFHKRVQRSLFIQATEELFPWDLCHCTQLSKQSNNNMDRANLWPEMGSELGITH